MHLSTSDSFRDLSRPEHGDERRAYARELLAKFAARAFRRPVPDSSVDRLVAIAETVYGLPDKRFEDGVARAMVPVLASPSIPLQG